MQSSTLSSSTLYESKIFSYKSQRLPYQPKHVSVKHDVKRPYETDKLSLIQEDIYVIERSQIERSGSRRNSNTFISSVGKYMNDRPISIDYTKYNSLSKQLPRRVQFNQSRYDIPDGFIISRKQ